MKFTLTPRMPDISSLTDHARQQAARWRESLDQLRHQHLDPWLNPLTPKAILFASDDAWRLAVLLDDQPPRYADVPPPPNTEQADTPELLSARVHQAFHAILAEVTPDLSDAPIDAVLALPASWCYSAEVSTEGLPRGNRHTQPLLYRLEEKLPLPAEDVTADFQVHGAFARGLAVATARLRPLLIALERHNVHVHTIAPTALLAAQGAISLRVHGVPSDTPRLVLLGNGDNVDLILLEGSSSVNAHTGRPWLEAWHHLPCDAAMVNPWINLQCLRQPSKSLQIEAISLPSAFLADLRQQQSSPLIVWEDPNTTTHELASRAAVDILVDRDTPWFNLRQGALGAA
ncbi:MAG: hypothetical protein IT442_13275, partial [Phycisphaeraceae bacterium]|nr:hypothetical protein [Phycisphaeraceae bacterium]